MLVVVMMASSRDLRKWLVKHTAQIAQMLVVELGTGKASA